MRLTYLIGAGASAEAIPVVSNFQERLNKITKFLLSKTVILDNEFPSELNSHLKPKEALISLIEDLNNLSKNIAYPITVDMYAKSLYDRNTPDSLDKFYKLKIVLLCYLLIEQSIAYESYNTFDKRYLPWISNITDNSEGVPIIKKDIDILSWNYDIQIELALMNISGNYIESPFNYQHQFFPRIGRYKIQFIDINNNRVIKLNGTAGLHTSFGEVYTYINTNTDVLNKPLLMNILKAYDNYTHDFGVNKLLFYYSWEVNENSKKALELAL